MRPPFYNITKTNIKGAEAKRLHLILRTRSCEFAALEHGGCTVCGFNTVSEEDIDDGEILSQLDYVLKREDMNGILEIDLFRAGSFFNDNEISEELRKRLMADIACLPAVQRVTVESRTEYLDDKKIEQCKRILGNKIFEVAIGLESKNDHIRNDIIRKNLSLTDFERGIETIKRNDAELMVYVLLKPPFISEEEAIQDAIETIKYGHDIGKEKGVYTRVALEPVFICQGTMLEDLYLRGEYRLLNSWSLIKVLQNSYHFGPIFVGLSDENLSHDRMLFSCPECHDRIMEAVDSFNGTQDILKLNTLDCRCRKGVKY